LAVGPKFKSDISYRRSAAGNATCEIYSDGFPAVPGGGVIGKQSSRYGVIAKPIVIFVVGTLLTLVVSAIYRIRRRPDLRASFEIVAESLLPFWSVFALPQRIVANKDYKRYRNDVLEAMLQKSDIEFIAMTEGKLNAENPEEFWDIRLRLHGVDIGIDVHTESQGWLHDDDRFMEFCARLSHMTKVINGKSFLAFDKRITPLNKLERLSLILTNLNRASSGHEITLVFGRPSEVADEITSMMQQLETQGTSGA